MNWQIMYISIIQSIYWIDYSYFDIILLSYNVQHFSMSIMHEAADFTEEFTSSNQAEVSWQVVKLYIAKNKSQSKTCKCR